MGLCLGGRSANPVAVAEVEAAGVVAMAWMTVADVCSVSAACPANAAAAVGAGTGCGALAAACIFPRA